MSHFPLYDQLLKDIGTKPLSSRQKKALVTRISKLDVPGKELVYVLIRMYQVQSDTQNVALSLPYEGTYTKEGVQFDVHALPVELQLMLHTFTIMHITKMKEDSATGSK